MISATSVMILGCWESIFFNLLCFYKVILYRAISNEKATMALTNPLALELEFK